MFQSFFGGRLAFRAALSGLVLAFASASLSTPAEARRHRHGAHRVHAVFHPRVHHRHHLRHEHAAASVAGGATAAIAVDGASGHVIWGMNEHALRHPASVTKVMTLYLLFEQLEKGKMSLDDQIPISAHAAAQAPSKLGLRPGSTIRVEDAIKAVVTKSANDIAVAIAEAVGGSEGEFAEMMTRKAHALGMSQTVYVNASGLPSNAQITTAWDLAILGRDIQARFPRYYRYFSLREFAWHGQHIANHNHLLGHVVGMDGIKTGYTVASGFNLLASVHRDGHYLVTVVLGGKTHAARDAYMKRLIEANIDEAGGRGAVQTAEREQPEEAEAAPERAEPAPEPRVARKEARPEPLPAPVAAESRAPEPPRLQIAAVIPEPRPRPAYVAAVAQPSRDSVERSARDDARRPALDGSTRTAHEAAAPATPGMRWMVGAPPAVKAKFTTRIETARVEAKVEPKVESRTERKKQEEADADASANAKDRDPEKAAAGVASSKPAVSGWTIQIGASDDVEKAAALLKSAKEKRAALLASARPYTEAVRKGKDTFYRARFAGLEEARAEAACKALKTSGFSCFATRN
jgi:D-alanyl-D-alanine carboxypeptidase